MATRAWCFTLNNYTAQEVEHVKSLDVLYLIFGREIGESGTPHLQGYVYLKLSRLSAMKKLIPRAHWEPARGSPEQASVYCEKDGDFFEKGTRPAPGARRDLDDVRNRIDNGESMGDVVSTANYQQIKLAEIYLKYREPKRNWEPEVYWFWGPPGSGKTRHVHELCVDVYMVPDTPNLKWWDRYDGHEDVCIDDFRGSSCEFTRFLKLVDRYEFVVETKGGSRQLRAKRIYITSCVHPANCWYTNENLDQLQRRLTEIKYFPKVQTKQVEGWRCTEGSAQPGPGGYESTDVL